MNIRNYVTKSTRRLWNGHFARSRPFFFLFYFTRTHRCGYKNKEMKIKRRDAWVEGESQGCGGLSRAQFSNISLCLYASIDNLRNWSIRRGRGDYKVHPKTRPSSGPFFPPTRMVLDPSDDYSSAQLGLAFHADLVPQWWIGRVKSLLFLGDKIKSHPTTRHSINSSIKASTATCEPLVVRFSYSVCTLCVQGVESQQTTPTPTTPNK